jgi:hypothetical protein
MRAVRASIRIETILRFMGQQAPEVGERMFTDRRDKGETELIRHKDRHLHQVGCFEKALARRGMMSDDHRPQVVGKAPVACQPPA